MVKAAHSERKGAYLYRNVPGNMDNYMFASAVADFKSSAENAAQPGQKNSLLRGAFK